MDDLDKLFKDAAMPVTVSDDLMARILADALREQPVPKPFGQAAAVPNKLGLWAMLRDLFGGGGVLAGLASVACAGLYLGIAQPGVIGNLTLVLTGNLSVEQLDYMPSIDAILAEE